MNGNWTEVQHLPPVDAIVLLHLPRESEHAIWLGYWDGIAWHTDAGVTCAPSHWQQLPEPPGASNAS
ncbi:MAG: DUF551 domain-containing protein [Planctomycetota bacterium]